MATSLTDTLTKKEAEEFLDNSVKKEEQKALNKDTPFWSGVEWFLNWVRYKFKTFIEDNLGQMPVIGKWASRIGTSISDFMFAVLVTTVHLLKVALTSLQMWKKAHEVANKAWKFNEPNGILSQTYAYGKKMVSYLLEIIKQCLERAIKAHGLEVSADEISDISDMFDNLLQ